MGSARSEEITPALAPRTTRRAIVRTGAKLAYVAPAVAASLSLTARGAAAVSDASICIAVNGDCTGFSSADCCGDLACRRVEGGGGTRTCRPRDDGSCLEEGEDCTGHSSADCCGDLACRRVEGGGGVRTCRP